MKILFLAANPQSTSRLKLDRELREIEEALKMSRQSSEFELIQKWDVRPRDFRRALLEYEPDIVHFSGHGEDKTGLVIIDPSGAEKLVSSEALSGLFAEFPQIKCVLLNACYSEVQAQAIVNQVDYVIGMKDTIYDKAAIAFSIGFYDGLGYGRNIEKAFNLGKNAILWEYGANSGKTRSRKLIPVDFEQVESQESLPEHLKPILLKKRTDVAQVISPSKNQNNIPTPTTEPIQEYRARVIGYLADRILDPIEQFQLATLAKELGISEAQANSILQAELDRIEQAKLDYQTVLRQTIEQGYYPFNSKIERGLKDIQKKLKLIDSEVEKISKPILEQAQQSNLDRYRQAFTEAVEQEFSLSPLTYEELNQLRQSLNLSQETVRQIERSIVDQKARELEQDSEPITELTTPSESTDKPPAISVAEPRYIEPTQNGEKFAGLPLWTVEFETVTVNARGEKASRSTHQAKFFKEDLGNGVILEMVAIPAGEFMMGSPREEKDGGEDESPQHKVLVPAFFMGKFAIKKAQYRAIMGSNPAHFQGDNRPVETISWHDATEFCQKLSEKTGRNYRLPSEAEWEYACRAGTTTPFHFGATLKTNLANYNGNYTYQSEAKGEYRQQTIEVGSFPPNAFGLYDMHGNVWEWCADDWHSDYNGAPSDGSAWRSSSTGLFSWFSRKVV